MKILLCTIYAIVIVLPLNILILLLFPLLKTVDFVTRNKRDEITNKIYNKELDEMIANLESGVQISIPDPPSRPISWINIPQYYLASSLRATLIPFLIDCDDEEDEDGFNDNKYNLNNYDCYVKIKNRCMVLFNIWGLLDTGIAY